MSGVFIINTINIFLDFSQFIQIGENDKNYKS